MKNQRTEDIIRAYLSGEDSPEGKALFDQWYASLGDGPPPALDASDRERLQQKMLREIRHRAAQSPAMPAHSPPSVRRRMALPHYRMAASLVGLLMLALVGFWCYRFAHRTTVITTTNAEVRELMLPDGSTAILNANSVLRYHPDWEDQDARQVWLQGEALFSVAHTLDDQKFVVHTPVLDVQVLGTVFNVRHRRHQTAVVLEEGSVAATVPASSRRVTMQPGERIQYTAEPANMTRRRVDTKQYTAWQNQQLSLNNTSLGDIAELLEDYYGFEVVVAQEELRQLRLSSTNTLSLQHPDVLLRAISEIFSLKLTQTQNKIYWEAK